MIKYRLAVLASGEGTNLQALIDEVHFPGIANIVLVLSDKEGAGAIARARTAGITAVPLPPLPGEGRKLYHQRVAGVVQQASPHLVVLAGYMRLLPPEFVAQMPPIINVHPSLLPAFPGLDSPAQALAYGAKISGCTVHLVDQGMDTGPVISQRALPVLPEDTPDSLHTRIKFLEHEALVQAVTAFALGQVEIHNRNIQLKEDNHGNKTGVNQRI
ncbi:MAG: phosphoribosylglycinamide formyltransferase [Eubacteriales bacterium]|nr:phosphoribosylglycinamide formyltransferase [Eubacteriales bacterium]